MSRQTPPTAAPRPLLSDPRSTGAPAGPRLPNILGLRGTKVR